MNYDAVIAGGGPAGLSAAITIAKRNYKTCVIERSKFLGYPIHDSGATFADIIDEFNLSQKVIANRIDGITLVSPKGHQVSNKLKHGLGYILERGQLNKELAKIAIRAGVEIKMPYKAISPTVINGTVKGLVMKSLLSGETLACDSKITIDATGVNSTLAKIVGIHPGSKNIRWAIGAEYEMANVELENPNFIELYFGSNIAPSGYAWIFPKSESNANVGVGITAKPENIVNLNKYLDKFIKEHIVASGKLNKAQPVEYHKGILPIGPMLNSAISNGFIAIGDAACQVSPHLGEGIRFVMKSGKIAGDAAIDSIEEENCSKEYLMKYDRRIKEEIYPNYDLLYKIHEYACNKDDKSWERTIKNLDHLLDSESGKNLLLKVIRGDVRKLDIIRSSPSFAFKGIKKLIT